MVKKIIATSLLFCSFLAAGCSQNVGVDELKPSETYLNYHAAVAEGISFDQDAAYHSIAKQKEVRAKIEKMQETSEQTLDQLINLYLQFNQRAAKCAELILREEKIQGKTAYLVFDRKDICGDGQIKAGGETITMVEENGWKIHDSLSKY